MNEIITKEQMRLIALEEGLRSSQVLDELRLKMLNQAVDWICDLTGLSLLDVRRMIAQEKSRQVARHLDTIKAVRSVLKSNDELKQYPKHNQ